MNNPLLLHEASSKGDPWSRLQLVASSRLTKATKGLWHAADLGPIVTFATGVIVGLLIPSKDWVAIVMVIIAGAVLRRIVKVIDTKLGLAYRTWTHHGQKQTEDQG
jgi:hypothetical protein